MVAEPDPVNAGTHFSLDQIADLAREAGSAGNNTLGFYIGRFQYSFSVAIERGPETICTKHVRIELDMKLADRRIEIGRELEHQPCRFAAALRHYERKAKADEAAFARFVESVAVTLHRGTVLPGVSVSADSALDVTARAQVEQWVKTLVDKSKESFNSERVAALQGVDTPEEMQRLAQACAMLTRP